KLLQNFSIICFGGGRPSSKETDLMAHLGLSANCVTYMNGRDPVLAGLYASAKAFVYPSLYEGFGIPPLEAMSFGCPVVCADTGSLPEVVGEAARLFDPTRVSSLQDALESVLSSPAHIARLKSKGRERAKMFSWEKCAAETLNVYKIIMGG
ncbi:MAG: glycosyltransferase family 1 protein, partial [Spirochaetota bacterium]|nr:glycosyltransferase family 1 protein [Spirochaetota bacterium]